MKKIVTPYSPLLTRLSILALGLSTALLAGCSFIPNYERPQAPVPESYAQAAATRAANDHRAAADIAWQDYFSDPRLQRLIEIALEHNRDLRVAMLNVEQARAMYQIQRSEQFPTVSGIAAATRQPTGPEGYSNRFQVGVGITAWEIDFFGRIAALKEQSLAQYLATEEARKSAHISLVSAVASSWLALLADEELLDLSRRTLATREESARLMQLRLDKGVGSELEYHQADSLAQAARATWAQQRRQRMQDENALTLLLGQPLPEDIRTSLPSSHLAGATPMPPLPAGLPSDLLERRPDIRMAEQQLIAANANIGAARAALFPRISLTAQFGSTSSELSDLFKSGTWAFSLAPQLVQPLFDSGRNRANVEAAQVRAEIAVAQYEKSIQTAFREVSDALAGLSTWQEQLDAQIAQAKSEARRLELADRRYRHGVASHLDLLDAQRSLFATQQALVVTRLQQLNNQVTLYKVLGGGWTDETSPNTTASAALPTANR